MTDTPRPISARVQRILIEAMAKHLPPSAAALRLLDVNGAAGETLAKQRADLDVIAVSGDPAAWGVDEASADAVAAYDSDLSGDLLTAALRALRPGGRLIAVDPRGEPSKTPVIMLESAGYDRILVETAAECPLPVGVLMRGEKPHTTNDTLARVRVAATDAATALADFRGRYVHLLVKQTPNKPAWKLEPGETITWDALALDTPNGVTLLAFSSLPNAVAFMQPAVLVGKITDVGKVAKFSRDTALAWRENVILNPDPSVLDNAQITLISVDPSTAETPDE